MPRNEPSPHPETAHRQDGWHLRAVLTDVQFWVPMLILLAGVLLLVLLRA